jgi:hypothetical protein
LLAFLRPARQMRGHQGQGGRLGLRQIQGDIVLDRNVFNFLIRRIKKETKKFNTDYDVLEPFELTEYTFEGLPEYGFNSFYNSKKDLELKLCKMLYEIGVVDFWIYDLEPQDPKRIKLIKTVRQFLNNILE